MSKKKPNVKLRASAKPSPTLLIGVLRSAVISLGVGILLMLLLCGILLTTEDPGTYAPLAAALLPFPIALLCGILTAKQSQAGGLLSGLLGGGVLCLLLLGLGAVLPSDTAVDVPSVLGLPMRLGACLLLSAVGGYCVTHQKPKNRRRHP